MRIVEFFCGIGGCAAACPPSWQVLAAIDIDQQAIEVYRRNFCHPTWVRGVEHVSDKDLQRMAADLWWFSPPCQPFTVRGKQRDLDDPRAAVFQAMIAHVQRCQPRYVALENVAGFQHSRARALWVNTLHDLGYQVRERLLCPSSLGMPVRRPRWYVMAAQRWGNQPDQPNQQLQSPTPRPALAEFIDDLSQQELVPWELPRSLWHRYQTAMHVVDRQDRSAVCNCFTSAYGRSPVRSGSYIATERGIRYATPTEIVRLLGFPPRFQWPAHLTTRRQWALAGNSLSVTAVRAILAELTGDPALSGAATLTGD